MTSRANRYYEKNVLPIYKLSRRKKKKESRKIHIPIYYKHQSKTMNKKIYLLLTKLTQPISYQNLERDNNSLPSGIYLFFFII
jgi:hypothetical protein